MAVENVIKTGNFIDLISAIKYIIMTGIIDRRLPDGTTPSPLSGMLISPPERFKTTVLLFFEKLGWFTGCHYLTDISPTGLIGVLSAIDKGKLYAHHMIFPDLTALTSNKKAVVNTLFGMLNVIIEEGTQRSLYNSKEYTFKNRIQLGILTGTTTMDFDSNFNKWNKIGFLSRLLPLHYDFSQTTIDMIMKGRLGYTLSDIFGDMKNKIIQHKEKDKPVEIGFSNKETQMLLLNYTYEIVNRLGQFTRVYKTPDGKRIDIHPYKESGIRKVGQLIILAKAIAHDMGYQEINIDVLGRFNTVTAFIDLPRSGNNGVII